MERDVILDKIVAAIKKRFEDRGETISIVNEETPVDSRLGLDSLDWAIVVVELEETLNCDPFAQGGGANLSTVADLVALYENHLSKQ